jgi:drug/metabolite transporter (DMT)-like permease
MTLVGIWFWEPMTPRDWGWMAGLCVTGALGHWLLIRAYEVAEASAVQPFAYLQLVFGSRSSASSIFGETIAPNVALGAADRRGGEPLHALARTGARRASSAPAAPLTAGSAGLAVSRAR